MNSNPEETAKTGWRSLPRNVWAVSLTSFFMDVSSEMILNILPLFLNNVLGLSTGVIGLIEGVAEATASVLKVFSGWLSDKLGARKWLAVSGYGISALAKPLFYVASIWTVAGARWGDRVGKGVRTAPRDALVADSIDERQRGLAFGVHRAADTGGAVVGLIIALVVVLAFQASTDVLRQHTYQTLVLISLLPAVLAVLSLAIGARDVPVSGSTRERPVISFRGLGKPFLVFMLIVGLFDLGNSSDAFLVLLGQNRGLNVPGVLGMLITFNLVYTLISAPAGSLSDRIGRRKVIIGGWLAYAAIYLGFALSRTGWQVWMLYGLYGVYYGLAYGTTKALVADLVPAELRGTAYGTYNATLGILDFPASLIAGVLWQGAFGWQGFGPSAPFFFGAGAALLAAVFMILWKPPAPQGTNSG